MTPEQLRDPRVLRAIDALVAEHVMGWTDIKFDETYGYPLVQLRGYSYTWGRTVIPYFTREIAAAWEVVEKLSEDKFGLLLELGETNWNEETNRVYNAGFGKIVSPVSAQSFKVNKIRTAPLAICLAALKAVLGDKYEETLKEVV